MKEIQPFESVYINAGLLNRFKAEKAMTESMLVQNNIITNLNPSKSMLLNRQALNPELVFNPLDPFGGFDPLYNSKWYFADECFYCKRHRYVQVMYNKRKPELNDLKEVKNQERLIEVIEQQLAARGDGEYSASHPIIIANGHAY